MYFWHWYFEDPDGPTPRTVQDTSVQPCEGHVPLSLSLSYRPPPTAVSIGASFLKWEGPTCIGRHLRSLAWYIVTSFRKLLSSGVLYKVRTSTNTMCGCDVCPPEGTPSGGRTSASRRCVRQQPTVLHCCPIAVSSTAHTRAFSLACCWVMTSCSVVRFGGIWCHHLQGNLSLPDLNPVIRLSKFLLSASSVPQSNATNTCDVIMTYTCSEKRKSSWLHVLVSKIFQIFGHQRSIKSPVVTLCTGNWQQNLFMWPTRTWEQAESVYCAVRAEY